MGVSWNRIKENSDRIVEEFDELYTYYRDYDECKRILTDIFEIYSAKYNIQLDEKEEFHHIFHELYSGIQKVINSYTPTDLSDQIESNKIDKLFEQISEDVFQTAEIRGRLKEIDPSNLELISAYEQGIKDAENMKSEINETLDSLNKIYNEIFGTDTPNLRVLTDSELDVIEHFNIIKRKLIKVEEPKNPIPTMTVQEDVDNTDAIDILKADIEEEKDRIRHTKLVDESKLNSISVDDISGSLTKVGELIDELNTKATSDFDLLQSNLLDVRNKHSRIYALAGMDFSKMNPSTKDGRIAINEAYKPFLALFSALKNDLKKYDKEIETFSNQIKQLEEEQKILETEEPDEVEILEEELPPEIKSGIEKDMKYYEDMVDAQMYGSKDYKERYDQYLSIFKKNILSGDSSPKFVLRNEDGTEILNSDGKRIIGKYNTVDYDGIEKDLKALGLSISTEELIKFLQLEDYKAKLERDSRILAGDKLSMTEYKSYKKLKEAKTPEELSNARQLLKAEIAEDRVYLNTFHYATNDYEFKRQHHSTAGKIGETYIPLQEHEKGEGLGKALQISAHNLYAYTRWQNPFKAKSKLIGVGTFVLNIGNLVTLLPRLATKGTGLIISKLGYKKDSDPNPYNGRRDARRGARVDWYRENGDGAFVSRLKGWIDEFDGKRRIETEDAIKTRHLEEIRKGLEESYEQVPLEHTISQLEIQKQIIRQNMKIRADDIRTIASSRETQGDIIRDPKDANMETLSQRTIQRVALEYAGIDSRYVSNTGERDFGKNPYRNTQFSKEEAQLNGNGRIIDIIDIKGVKAPERKPVKFKKKTETVISADPIGRAIRSREIKNTLTRLYAIEEAALIKGQSALVRWGIGKIKDTKTITSYKRPETDTNAYSDPIIEDKNIAGNIKMGDLQYTDRAYFEHTASLRHRTCKWIEPPIAANTQAISLDFKIPNNLSADEYQLLSKYGLKVGDRVSYSIADEATKNLCNATGKKYATQYIEGLFNFSDNTNITDAINQYFPKSISEPFDIILGSKNYSGDTGVQFLTDSFATSHGISDVMSKMNSWGTGWGIESVNSAAIETSKKVVKFIGGIPDDPNLIKKYAEQPIYQWVQGPIKTISIVDDPFKQKIKRALTKIVNGIGIAGYASEIHDLGRKSKNIYEPGRETYESEKGDDR